MNDGRSVEISAKKPEDAIKQGLEQLGVTLDDVKVEVLETGGLFRKAKVRLTVERDEEDVAKEEKPAVAPARHEARAEKREEQKPAEANGAVKSENTDKPEKTEKKPEKKAEKKATAVAKKPADGPAEKSGKAAKSKKAEPKNVNGKNDSAQADPCEEPAQARNVSEENTREEDSTVDRQKSRRDDRRRQEEPDRSKRQAPSAHAKPRKLREEEKEALSRALEFVKTAIEKMGFDATVEADADDPEKITVTAADGDDSLIIGRHGETLSALSYLAETAERAEKCKVNVTVDCNGYRARRAASLTAMARRRAKECAQRHRKIKLEPMDRVDRRTVHFALADNNRVTTASEGKEPYRCVVIFPNDERRRGEAFSRENDESDGEYEE